MTLNLLWTVFGRPPRLPFRRAARALARVERRPARRALSRVNVPLGLLEPNGVGADPFPLAGFCLFGLGVWWGGEVLAVSARGGGTEEARGAFGQKSRMSLSHRRRTKSNGFVLYRSSSFSAGGELVSPPCEARPHTT